jgi:hypothetical protein
MHMILLCFFWLRGQTANNVASRLYWLVASPREQNLVCFLQRGVLLLNFRYRLLNVTPEVVYGPAIVLPSHFRVLKNGLLMSHLVDHFMAALHHPLAHILAQNTEPNRFYR